MGTKIHSTHTWTPPADLDGDRMLAGIERKLGLHNGKYDERVKAGLDAARIGTGKYRVRPMTACVNPRCQKCTKPRRGRNRNAR